MNSIEIIRDAIESLEPRERAVLVMRFIDKKTLEEVGRHFDVTRERIRQLEAKSCEKLYKAIILTK